MKNMKGVQVRCILFDGTNTSNVLLIISPLIHSARNVGRGKNFSKY